MTKSFCIRINWFFRIIVMYVSGRQAVKMVVPKSEALIWRLVVVVFIKLVCCFGGLVAGVGRARWYAR